jgi:hypothetical protein
VAQPLPAGRASGLTRQAPKHGSVDTVVIAVVGLAYVFAFLWTLGDLDYDTWGGFVVIPFLLAAGLAVIKRMQKADPSPGFTRLAVYALLCKLLGTFARFSVAYVFYGGRGDDANQYHIRGAILAQQFRAAHFDLGPGRLVGTKFIDVLTGIVYSVTGVTKLGGFLVFSWLAFVGLLLFYRAFQLAFPSANHRRYALFVFLYPSLLFWSSSIGKEAWMIFCLGLAANGVARVLTFRSRGFVFLFFGLVGTAAVRPHMTLVVMVALLPAYLLRRQRQGSGGSQLGPVTKVIGVAVLLAGSFLLVAQVETFLKLDSLSGDAVDQALQDTSAQTTQQDSAFQSVRPHDPTEFPKAAYTVLFRPFPYEAHNRQAFIAAAEGMLLLWFTLRSRRQLLAGVRMAFTEPYVAFAWGYATIFIFAFSSFGNFGILTRERIQLFPVYFVLLCLPTAARKSAGKAALRATGYGVTARVMKERAAVRAAATN